MRQKQMLVLGAIKVESFVTALEPKEQRAIHGGSDRWYICGFPPPPTEPECDTVQNPVNENITDPDICR